MKNIFKALVLVAAFALLVWIMTKALIGQELMLKGGPGYTKPASAGTDYSNPASVTSQMNAWAGAFFSGNTAQYMRANGTIADLPTSMAPTGSAGGDLTGTYPNPTLGATGVTASTYAGVTVDAKGRVTAGTNGTFTNNASRSIVTNASAANGWQVSPTRPANVAYSVAITKTATIGGGSTGYVLLEIAATNSATPGDWQEVARLYNGQTITLAVALQSVQVIAGQIGCVVPVGYYVRLRSVNVAGSPSYSYQSGQEVVQ